MFAIQEWESAFYAKHLHKMPGLFIFNIREAEIDGSLRFANYPSLATSVSSRFIEETHLEKQDKIKEGTCY